ncbi:MAG: peptide/nickel transport system permease protein [Rhodobacteraceae bacterium HLUCCA12]|nr:MAG: peptide/nickel transport system permease protein [Rhodobacteraceae bacterium HLUCCA12]
MIPFILRRLIQIIPVIIGVTLATFLLTWLIPGDPTNVLLGPDASEEARERLRRSLGLDRSMAAQYLIYMSNLLSGDLGQSLSFSRPVADVLVSRMANTALLAFAAIVLASVAGVAAGTWAALRPGSLHDRGLTIVVLFLNSMPSFWLGLVLILIFGLQLRLLPVSGMAPSGAGLLSLAAHMILPTITLAAWSLASIARMTRAAVLEVINNDFIRTARSRGLSEWRIVLFHVLPNAIPAVLTVIGMQMGFLFSGAVLTETVFSWPGVGLAMFQAIAIRDIPLIQGGILMLALIFVLINLIVDVLYVYFNPKIKLN